MRKLGGHRLAAIAVSFGLLCGVLADGARAQPAAPNTPVPATLRLAQVVPRLSLIHMFALAQSEAGTAIPMQPSQLKALIGSNPPLPVQLGDDEGIVFVFLIDVSGSMRSQLDGIKAQIRWWIDSMTPADRAAIITFGSRVVTAKFTPDGDMFTPDHAALKRTVDALAAQDKDTLLYQGVIQAMDLARRLDLKLPLRRAIVMLTDGLDDQQGGAGRQQAEDAMSIDPIPIYGIGVSDKSVKVDTALKDFSALVYRSGGAYRRVEVLPRSLPDLRQDYVVLRGVVANTHHFTTDCQSCYPDGSPVEVRLRLTQGAAEVNSGSVRVLSVAGDGKPVPRPPPQPPQPQLRELQHPDPHIPSWWELLLKWITRLGWQWLVLAGLALTGVIAALVAFFLPKPPPAPDTTRIYPEPGPTQPSPPDPNGVIIMQDAITPGTQLEAQRLRITPLGHNDVPAQERVFTGELTVGRSQDNQINIYNDTQVSSKHCTLAPKDGLILVCDEGSRNGTRVNGVPLEQFMHAEPDSVLGVGRTELRMQLLAPGRQ